MVPRGAMIKNVAQNGEYLSFLNVRKIRPPSGRPDFYLVFYILSFKIVSKLNNYWDLEPPDFVD